jgi:phage repressor protein C with HTH and peptisase S24 domain
MAKFGFMGLRRVKVAGESMSPTFNDGDVLLVKWFTGIERELPLTSVVVIEREEMPGVFFIKRIQKSHSGTYWVEGDNRDSEVELRMSDSRTWGYIPAHEVRGRVLLRLQKTSERKLQQ